MTKEDKELLLIDLSTRLPYGVICAGITRYIPFKVKGVITEIHNYKLKTTSVRLGLISLCKLETVKPYLRPMSSMTEEEWNDYKSTWKLVEHDLEDTYEPSIESYDWLNAHHFDYRGLIERSLAIKAPENMYKKGK